MMRQLRFTKEDMTEVKHALQFAERLDCSEDLSSGSLVLRIDYLCPRTREDKKIKLSVGRFLLQDLGLELGVSGAIRDGSIGKILRILLEKVSEEVVTNESLPEPWDASRDLGSGPILDLDPGDVFVLPETRYLES